MDAPPQSFCADGSGGDGRVSRWIASDIHQDLAVVGRVSRVRSRDTVWAENVKHSEKACSRLLMVNMKWRTPLFGQDQTLVITGHLRNTSAKMTGARGYTICLLMLQTSALAEVELADWALTWRSLGQWERRL